MAIRDKAEKGSKGSGSTQIYVYYDVGYPNGLFIRGKGAGLNWDKGQAMQNAGPDLWIWESKTSFSECEFKVLINDEVYEIGENHKIAYGSKVQYTPRF